jgi:glutamine phosphoribosylpyrophosphate amidotransferase
VHSQPVFVRKAGVAFAHNGNLPITDKLEAFLDERDVAFEKLNDSEMMAEAIGCFVQDGLSLEAAVIKAYPMFEGAFVGVV